MAVVERIYNGGGVRPAQRGIENPVNTILILNACFIFKEMVL